MTHFEDLTASLISNSRGHVWQKDEDGLIDFFAMETDYHNGPVCILCGYEYCHHCHPFPLIDCPYSTTTANLNPTDLYELEQT